MDLLKVSSSPDKKEESTKFSIGSVAQTGRQDTELDRIQHSTT